ncbi:Heat repeat protein [Mycena kentingensis (nom. inval.)]|nr:Heat repeat protein [Mycena kentingensis (nom. inval.)]
MLENDVDAAMPLPTFPESTFKNLSTRSAQDALTRMFRDLGTASGDSCVPSIEWFISVGKNGTGSHAVSAIWCACRLLEGVAGVSILSADGQTARTLQRSKRLDKLARGLAKSISELWDVAEEDLVDERAENLGEDDVPSVLLVKGVDRLEDSLKIIQTPPPSNPTRRTSSQPTLHRILCLQLLAVISGVLQARSAPLLLYTLYPVLHSLVSPIFHLSSTALATLHYMSRSASYASPASLLLSNFDYALDAVSRRLTRRWLDIDASKVLVVLVRLVGSDVVDKASDVVEECFDRLDEFHGYDVVVEGLVEVLGEVIKVIELEEASTPPRPRSPSINELPNDTESFQSFLDWFPRRHVPPEPDSEDIFPPVVETIDEEPKQNPAPEPLHVDQDPISTPTQLLTKQIVTRSLFFLTHGSPVIRARILSLLAASVPVLPDSALLPQIHNAWPFILNRLADSETYVVAATATLIDALVTHAGTFMYRRMWDDVWPRYRTILDKLDTGDASSALSRRSATGVGTESAYTHSHRLYRAILRSMTATMKGVRGQDASLWQASLAFRRFLHRHAHEELQKCARDFYLAASEHNADVVWLVLRMSLPEAQDSKMAFLRQDKWRIEENVEMILCLVP